MKPISRIYYAAGPGDIVGTFRHWLEGRDDPQQLAMTYSGQCFSFARNAGAQLLAVSSCARKDAIRTAGFEVRNRPTFRPVNGPIGYHIGRLVTAARLLGDLLRFRPEVAVISEGTVPWITLVAARGLGVKVIPALHCVLWPAAEKPSFTRLITRRADAFFFRRIASGCICVSAEIASQVKSLTGIKDYPCQIFGPSYRPQSFQSFKPSQPSADGSLRLLYAGRVEREKGVFDLLEAMRLLSSREDISVSLALCGNGGALEEARAFVQSHGLADRVHFHGHCQHDELVDLLEISQVVVVPTTSCFVEGFNKSVAEGVFAGRPVIATSVCPAVNAFAQAVTAIPPDTPPGIAEAIARLAQDPDYHARKIRDCALAASSFRDSSVSWKDALAATLDPEAPDTQRASATASATAPSC